LSDILQMVGN